MNLANKVAIVTGAARGIGRAIALSLAEAGCKVVIADVNLEGWKEYGGEKLSAPSVAEEVRLLGSEAIDIIVDVTKKDSAERMAAQTLGRFGKIDILVNNAGGLAGEVATSFASSVPEVQLRATIERNLYGTIFCSQAVAGHMKERTYGKIVNFGSQGGLKAQDFGIYAPYGAAKAAVMMYTRYLARELAPYQINVNAVVPAYVATQRLNATVFEVSNDSKNYFLQQVPLGRLAEPADIARVVRFLVDDESAYITGQCINVCGGFINF